MMLYFELYLVILEILLWLDLLKEGSNIHILNFGKDLGMIYKKYFFWIILI